MRNIRSRAKIARSFIGLVSLAILFACATSNKAFDSDDEQWQRRIRLVASNMNAGDVAVATEEAKELIVFSEIRFGKEHENTITTKNDLAVALMSQGRLEESEVLLLEASDAAKRTLGPSHHSTITFLNNLAETYKRQRKYDNAEEILRQVLEACETGYGSHDLCTASTMAEMGFILLELGRYDEAEILLESAQEEYASISTAGDEESLNLLNNRANIYSAQGRHEDAVHLARTVAELSRELKGENHPTTVLYVANLADFLREAGKYHEAEQLFRYVIEKRKRLLGENNSSTLLSMNNLAVLLISDGRYAEAEGLLSFVIEADQRTTDDGTWLAATASSNYVELLRDLGRYDEAIELSKSVVGFCENTYGVDAPDTFTAKNNLAGLYLDTGKPEPARHVFEALLESSTRLWGGNNPDTLTAMHNLAGAYSDLAQHEAAAEMYKAVVEKRSSVLGETHPDTLISLVQLGVQYELLGRYDEAGEILLKSLYESRRALPKNHIDRAVFLSNYAVYLSGEPGGLGPAILFQKEAVNIIQSVRFQLRSMDDSSQQSFADSYQEDFQILQDWLIEIGRFAEAEQVGRMLKEQEYYEFVRRSAPIDEDTRSTRSELTGQERAWDEQLNAWSDRSNKIAVELATLKTKRRAGDALTPLEESQLSDLETEYKAAYAEYKQNVNTWLASVRDLSDETIQAEARALEAQYHDDLQQEIAGIGDGVAVLQIVAFEDSLHFFLITPHAFKHIETPVKRSDLNEVIFAARRTMQPDPRTGILDPQAKVKLQALYNVLFAPVANELNDAGTETIMLNLQGAIRYVPFAALYDGSSYLTERYELALFTPAARTRYEAADDLSEATGFGTSIEYEPFSELPGVVQELETILGSQSGAGILSGPFFLNTSFTKEAFERELEEERPILHIASHFYMRPGNDSDSFLLLGDGSYLTLAEINASVGLRFKGVELITLSACSTALSTQGDYDVDSGTGVEVEGFGVLAQRKGAEAVVASLWDLNDGATATFMGEMYRGLSSGTLNKAEALQAAQLKLIGDHYTSHPYYWAPFILMGNWK